MAKENIYFTNDYRVLENGNSIIIGNIVNGQWFKCQKAAFDFLKNSAEQDLSIEEILEKCEDEYTKKYILKVIQLSEQIGAVSKNEVHKKIENSTTVTDVSLILTNGCNLRCRHCVASCGDFKRKDLSFEKIKRVIQWCNNKKIKELTLTGGEIFIRKDIEEILKYIHENYEGKISVITNGTLISDTILDTLVKCVDQIDISMDGYDDESVSKIRGKGVFDKVIDVIERLHHKGFKAISLSMVLTGENRKHVEEFKSLCVKYEVQEVLRVLSPGGRAADNFDELKDIDFEKEETETSDVSEYSFRCICQKLNSELSIDERGNVYPCVLLQDRGKEIGTIDDLEKGYLNQVTDKEPIVDIIDGCKECNVRYFCASNCVGLDLAIFNNAKAKQIHCDKMKKFMAQYGIDYMNNDKIKIGVIDSGFDINGCKIKNKIIKKYNFGKEKINIDSNIQDEHGHGTGVTKIVDDVCDDIEFIIFKVLNEKCQGGDWQLISALKSAITENIDILNISLGTTNKKEKVILGELCDLAKQSGIIIVTTCPNDENTMSFPYDFESVIKVKGNPKITDFNIYYDSNNIFWGRGVHHLIPWLNGNFTYSGSNSFSTPYVVIKIVEILKKNRNIDRKNIFEELKKECQPITELKELIIKEEECNRLELYKDVKEIIQNLLGKPIANKRLTLQGMTPELSLEVIKKIEERYHRTVSYSAYNYIDFEYISNIVNRIRFIDD